MGYFDMERAIREEERRLARADKTGSPAWLDTIATAITNIPLQRQRVAMYRDSKLKDQGDSLALLLEAFDNSESMEIWDHRLQEFKTDSAGSKENALRADAFTAQGNAKKKQFNNFSIGIQQASDFIDGNEYLSTQSDFQNLPGTVNAINAVRKAEGKNPFESPLEYLLKEKDKALTIIDKIMPGIKVDKESGMITGSNFRYNKANNNDKDVARKIMEYYSRIELAVKTLGADEIITPDEAKAILIGSMNDYIKTRDIALGRETNNYKTNKSLFARYSGYINTAKQKKLTNEDSNFMAGDPGFGDKSADYQILVQDLNLATGLGSTKEDWDKVIKTLTTERNSYKKLMDIANEKYKYWSGNFYEGGEEADDKFIIEQSAKQYNVTPEKYLELQKNARERGMDIDEFIGVEKEAFKQEPSPKTKVDIEFENKLKTAGHGIWTKYKSGQITKEEAQNLVKKGGEEKAGSVLPQPEVAGETLEIYNPGNLKFANQEEAMGEDDRGFAIFPSEEAGWDALYRQIELDKGRDLTLDQFINKYAPPSENDTAAYLKNVQTQLKTGKNVNINDLDTKKLANAIAKQEGYGRKFPEIEDDPPPPKPKGKKIATGEPLYKTYTNKREIRYGKPVIPMTTKSFKSGQSNLFSIASDKFSKLSASEKNKYKGSKKEATRQFVKDEFKKWLRKSGKYGKPYAEEDFKYFILTKVDASGKVNKNSDANIYTLFYPNAFDTSWPTKLKRPNRKSDSAYPRFAKDFDAFRKYLQEA